MSDTSPHSLTQSETTALAFGRRFLSSAAFRTLFREGMLLVEETAIYLDGQGREESRALPRTAALCYATESMRLTTRLMQVASWLLVQRAVAEGEITPEQAASEKNRVRLTDTGTPLSEEAHGELPQRLRELVAGSLRIQARVRHLEIAINLDERGTGSASMDKIAADDIPGIPGALDTNVADAGTPPRFGSTADIEAPVLPPAAANTVHDQLQRLRANFR